MRSLLKRGLLGGVSLPLDAAAHIMESLRGQDRVSPADFDSLAEYAAYLEWENEVLRAQTLSLRSQDRIQGEGLGLGE